MPDKSPARVPRTTRSRAPAPPRPLLTASAGPRLPGKRAAERPTPAAHAGPQAGQIRRGSELTRNHEFLGQLCLPAAANAKKRRRGRGEGAIPGIWMPTNGPCAASATDLDGVTLLILAIQGGRLPEVETPRPGQQLARGCRSGCATSRDSPGLLIKSLFAIDLCRFFCESDGSRFRFSSDLSQEQ